MTERKIEKNMLRERAKPLPIVTDEMWDNVLDEHRELVDEFLGSNSFRPKSHKQYRSNLRQFFYWVHKSMNDKPLYKITKRDFLRYIRYLRDRGMSSSGMQLKKSTVSSLCNYIENVVADDDDRYEKFRNFTRGLPSIPRTQTYDKIPVSEEEYKLMMNTLESDKNYLGMAWLATAYNVGARKSELIQIKTSSALQEVPDGKSYVRSNLIYAKGKGEGKQVRYFLNLESLEYMKLWLEKRGYEHEYVFTTTYGGEIKQMSESWADYFCTEVLTDIVGRRINVHLFKSTLVTRLLESGMKPEIVSKKFAMHESMETTSIYDLRDFEEELDDLEW